MGVSRVGIEPTTTGLKVPDGLSTYLHRHPFPRAGVSESSISIHRWLSQSIPLAASLAASGGKGEYCEGHTLRPSCGTTELPPAVKRPRQIGGRGEAGRDRHPRATTAVRRSIVASAGDPITRPTFDSGLNPPSEPSPGGRSAHRRRKRRTARGRRRRSSTSSERSWFLRGRRPTRW